jgi:hypothetical protein
MIIVVERKMRVDTYAKVERVERAKGYAPSMLMLIFEDGTEYPLSGDEKIYILPDATTGFSDGENQR